MRICSVIGSTADKINLLHIAEIFEAKGWEVQSPITGVGSPTSTNSRASYFHTNMDLVLVVVSPDFIRSHDEYYLHSLRLIQSSQLNVRAVSFGEDWLTSAVASPFHGISVLPYSAPALDDLILDLTDENEFANKRVTESDAVKLVQTICGLDDFDEISRDYDRATRYESRFHLFKRTARETENYEYWLFLYPSAQLVTVDECLKDLLPLESERKYLRVIRASKAGDLSAAQLDAARRVFRAECSSYPAMVKRYACYSEGQSTKSHPTYALTSKENYVDFDCKDIFTGEYSNAREEFQKQWEKTRNSNEKKIVIFKGTGGRGKTHLLRHLNSNLLETDTKTTYLNPAIIRAAYSMVNEGSTAGVRIECIYDAYEYFRKFQELRAMPKDLFEIELRSTKVVVFIDGVEEIRALLGSNFNERSFWSDCKKFSVDSSACQIVVASRFNFWGEDDKKFYRELELQPFDDEQLKAFLDTAFGSVDELKLKARKLIEQVSLVKEAGTSPFVADQICEMVKRELDKTTTKEDIDFESKKLVSDYPSDTLVGVLIDRDKEKVSLDWSVDTWCVILGNVAARSTVAKCSQELFITIIEDAIGRKLLTNEEKRVTVHCMINSDDGYIAISESHFQEFFLGFYLFHNVLSPDGRKLDRETALLIRAHLVVGSQINANIARWCKALQIDIAYNLTELKLLTDDCDENWASSIRKSEISSALFNLAIELSLSNATSRTSNELLDLFFGSADGFENASFHDFNGTRISDTKFDFKGKVMRAVSFRNYDGFWNCSFDKQTFWVAPKIFECKPPRKAGRRKVYGTFEGEEVSSEVRAHLSKVLALEAASADSVKKELSDFFSTMFGGMAQRKFMDKREFFDAYASKHLSLRTAKLVELIQEHGIIFETTLNKSGDIGYVLSEKGRECVLNLLDQRQLRGELSRVANELFKN